MEESKTGKSQSNISAQLRLSSHEIYVAKAGFAAQIAGFCFVLPPRAIRQCDPPTCACDGWNGCLHFLNRSTCCEVRRLGRQVTYSVLTSGVGYVYAYY